MKKKKDIVERILDYIGNTANKAAKKNAKDEARRQILKENPEMAKKLEEYDKNLEESFKKTQPIIDKRKKELGLDDDEWDDYVTKTLGW